MWYNRRIGFVINRGKIKSDKGSIQLVRLCSAKRLAFNELDDKNRVYFHERLTDFFKDRLQVDAVLTCRFNPYLTLFFQILKERTKVFENLHKCFQTKK